MSISGNLSPRKANATRGVLIALVLINMAIWACALLVFRDKPSLIGIAALAYSLGLRHAFDADHIVSIDNTVRQLLHRGRPTSTVGFFFALGHSTIVIVACLLVAVATNTFKGSLEQFREKGQVIGTAASATFLLMMAVANLLVLRSIWAAYRRVRGNGAISHAELDTLLANRGVLARFFRPLFDMIRAPWHMYPVGLLFGLGFDTATEVGLLAISAGQAASGLSVWAVLLFPALFTAGMSLMDTADSMMMTGAYGWAFDLPARKLRYNLMITTVSVIMALTIGAIEVLALIGDKLKSDGTFWLVIGSVGDCLGYIGFGIVVFFLAAWIVAAVIHRMKASEALETG